MPNIEEGEKQTLADGGYGQVVHPGGVLKLLPITAEIADKLAPAATAVQPEEVGTMGFPHSVNVQTRAEAMATLQALLDRVAALGAANG